MFITNSNNLCILHSRPEPKPKPPRPPPPDCTHTSSRAATDNLSLSRLQLIAPQNDSCEPSCVLPPNPPETLVDLTQLDSAVTNVTTIQTQAIIHATSVLLPHQDILPSLPPSPPPSYKRKTNSQLVNIGSPVKISRTE